MRLPERAEGRGDRGGPKRRALGSQRRAGWPCRASICIQAVISTASATTAHQIRFAAKECRGRFARPVSFADQDPVLAARPAPVAQLEVGELAGAGVGDERGDPHPVDVLEPQLGAGVGPFLADDHAHVLGPSGQVHQAGELGDPGPVADLVFGVVGRAHTRSGTSLSRSGVFSGRVNPTE